MTCFPCYEVRIECCEDIKFLGGFTAGEELQAIISMRSKTAVYRREVTIGNDLLLTISKDSLPLGFLADGFLEIELRTGESFSAVKQFTFAGKQYDCLMVELVHVNTQPA